VIINTKKGQAGATKLEVSMSTGVSSILKKIQVLDSTQFRGALLYYGVDTLYNKGANVDGMDGILRKGLQQNYAIGVSGGNDNAKYRFSAGYLTQDGIVTNTGFKKYSANITGNFKILDSKKLGLDFNLNSSQYMQDGSFLSKGNDGIIGSALVWNPTDSLRNPDGSVKMTPGDNVNPIALSMYARDNLKVTTVLGSIAPYYKFSDWLEYKLQLSVNYSTSDSRSSIGQPLAVYNFFPQGGLASIANNELITDQITQTLSFNKEILPGLRLNAVAGYEYMKFIRRGYSLSGNGLVGTVRVALVTTGSTTPIMSNFLMTAAGP